MSFNFASLMAAARRRFVVCALVSVAAFCAGPAAFAQNAVNTASVAPPATVGDPVAGNNTATDTDPISAAQLSLTKTHAGDFSVGGNGVYTLTLSNISTTAATTGTLTVADTLPAGLTFVSATGSGWTCGAVGQDVTCTSNAVLNPGASAPAIALTVAVGPAAAPSVANTARASGGGDATCPASGPTEARCNPSDPTTVAALPAINFCAANTVYNVTQSTSGATVTGSFYRFNLSGTDTLVPQLNLPVTPATTNFNALMVDPVRNRLLVISYSGGIAQLWAYDTANGGWYTAAPPLTSPDLPRAGMDASGVGYLMAGNSATPQVWRVTASGAFNYTIASIGNLSFDFAPTATSSGDMAFDAGGNAWMSAGQDIYKIDFSALPLIAVRQQRPLLNGSPSTIQWAGVAFGSDNRLYLATNSSANTYYRLNLATGALALAGSNAVSQARDLGSCAFPAEPQPAQLRVQKTLGLVNGAPYTPGAGVKAGDVLTYRIAISHIGGDLAATLFAGDVVDTLPANTTRVAAGNDFNCTGSNCTNANAVNVAVGATQTLNFVVSVNSPLPGDVSSIVNAVTVKDVDCAASGNDCGETTPVSPVIAVSKSSNPISGATVNPGDTIDYTLTVTVANSATTAPVTLTDTLSAGQTPGAMPAGCAVAGQVITCTLAAGAAPGTHAFAYPATVGANATGSVGNNVVPSGPDNPTCAAGACSTTHPIVATAVTVSKTSNPASGSTVIPGGTIQYTLSVNVANSATTSAITLTDTLSAGQTLGPMPSGCAAAGQIVTCTLAAGALPSGNPHTFVYSATVDTNAIGSVGNNVIPSGPDNPTCGVGGCSTTHPIVFPAVTVSKTSTPGSGATVNPGDTIQYTLTVSVADSATTAPVVLTDTLSAGQTLGAMPAGCSAAGQVVTCTLAAGALPSGSPYTFVYSATVDATATGSVSNAVVPSGPDNPTCGSCTTTHPIVPAAVTVSKASSPASGSTVNPGDAIQYTLTVNVANSATTGAVTLTDTLSAGQTLGAMPAGCIAAGQAVTCTLAAGSLPGTYTFAYPATVNANATGSVGNNVVPSGPDNPTCAAGGCTTTHPIVATAVTVSKASTPISGSTVNPGDTIQYTLTVNVADSATTGAVTLTDTLSAGQTLGPLPAGCAAAGQVVTCTLAPGALPANSPYTFVYSAMVDASATGSVGNNVVPSGPDIPVCAANGCSTTHPIVPTAVSVSKTSNPASGSTVNPGDTIDYTLTVTVANSATTAPVTLTDTLSVGQTLGAMQAGCAAAGRVVTCVLGAGALPGNYTFAYPATVDANATGSIGNAVVPSGPDNPTCAAGGCTTTHPIVATAVTVSKSSNPASGTTVNPGDTIQYTLSANVANSATTGAVTLTDTLSAGQTLGAMPAGCTAAGQVVTCVLAAGALPGGSPYTFVYTATVDANATGSVGNTVVPSGTDNPSCAAGGCATTHSIVAPAVTVAKTSDPASGTAVNANAAITYTVTVANSATVSPVVLNDTLSGDHSLTGTPTVPAGGACTTTANGLQCTLAAGALPGEYAFVYRTAVAATASGTIGNSVAATGGGTTDPTCTNCSTTHPIAEPVVQASKSSAPGDGVMVNIGDTIEYTLTLTIENAAITEAVTLTDTPGAGLTPGTLPEDCVWNGATIVCTLPAGTVPGTYTFVYPATVNADANGNVANAVAATGGSSAGGSQPTCLSCTTTHPVADAVQLRIVKQASPRDVKIGDLVRYTLTIENVGDANVEDATLIDTPPAGFSYVADSLTVADADGAGRLVGTYPIRVDRLDIRVGERATVQYLLRVGAGVRPGSHVNRAHAEDGGRVVSNEATAEVQLVADPLLDESLLVGTVFDDRDGDGWQDSAKLGGVKVQGGFAENAYVANSTMLDRGKGPSPQADASAPLLHGIDVGDVAARQSEAEPADARAVTISQTLSSLAFTDDFVLTSAQGFTLRMDAAGNTRVERNGDAAKGLSAADPQVERRVSQVEGGYRVDYVIRNAGIDERGIPGVRIASVEGLLIETDQFGRYHLEGVAGGPWERGRNFILKVDPATLPPGSAFTSENPLVRRITPGVPVRFDFAVKLPSGLVQGGQQTVEMELGAVMFDADSAKLRAEYAPVVEKMAEQVRAHGGGEILIAANGETQALAYDRAQAVRTALLEKLTPEQAKALTVDLRTDLDDPATSMVAVGDSPVLGTVLFDTDQATVKPEYAPLIGKIAADIERMKGGAIAVVGHADKRGADNYNTALGLRRAKAVFDAVAAKLSPEVRGKLRVDISEKPTAPVGMRGR